MYIQSKWSESRKRFGLYGPTGRGVVSVKDSICALVAVHRTSVVMALVSRIRCSSQIIGNIGILDLCTVCSTCTPK